MNAAEKWYEYQENDQNYRVDRKPERPRKKQKPKRAVISVKDKARLLLLTVTAGILCIGLIISTAYAASIKYDINQTIKANSALEAEIEMLHVKIFSANNIEAIEKKATGELGMVYPKSKQIVHLGKKQTPGADFAKELKKEAYN